MKKKITQGNGKREEIINAAFELFWKKGYDGTSIRMIMKKTGCEPGLFYYYFQNKDEVFDAVLDKFFEQYKEKISAFAEQGKRDPYRVLYLFFAAMLEETDEFRKIYDEHVHRTIRWAVREYTLTMIVPFVRQILDSLAAAGMSFSMDLDVLAVMLSHGAGSVILHEDVAWTRTVTPWIFQGIGMLTGIMEGRLGLLCPFFAGEEALSGILKLVQDCEDCFPRAYLAEFTEGLKERMGAEEILVICHEGTVAGCLAFSRARRELDFLAVAEEYRRQGIASRLLITAMARFPVGVRVAVNLFQTGDAQEENILRFYQKFGFQPTGLAVIKDCSCQRLSVEIGPGLPEIRKGGKDVD